MNPLLVKAEALSAAGTALVAIALLFGAYNFGRHVKEGEVAEAHLAQEQTIRRLRTERQDKADELALANAAHRAQAAPRERLITKEVTRYVQVTNPADRCSLPGTWRVRHDAAATGVPLAAESGPLATGPASAVDDAAALDTVATNYTTARECLARLAGWQQRYRSLEMTSTQ